MDIVNFSSFSKNTLTKKITVYNVVAHTETSVEFIANTFDYEEAKDEAISNKDEYRGYDIHISKYIKKFSIKELLELNDMSYEDFKEQEMEIQELIDSLFIDDIFEYMMDEGIEEDNLEIISFDSINSKSDEMINEVKDKLAQKLGIDYFKKYQDVKIDKNGNMYSLSHNDYDKDYEYKTIRIADHTHNPRNGSNDLNVIIAEKNPTINRYREARTDLYFDHNDDVNEIVDEILLFFKDPYYLKENIHNMKYIKLFEEMFLKENNQEENAIEELINTKALVGFYYMGLFIKNTTEIKTLIEKYKELDKKKFEEYFISEYKNKLKKNNREENTNPSINIILETSIGMFNVGFSIENKKLNFVNTNLYHKGKVFSKDYINSENVKAINIGKFSVSDKTLYRDIYKIINEFFKNEYDFYKFINHLELDIDFKWSP